jgi:hypothetical protein
MAFDPITQRADSVFFLGLATPGIARVEGNSGSPRKWQERGGFGFSGCTVAFTGLGLAKFDVLIELYTKLDWELWAAFLPILAPPKPGPNARALAVFHPFLAMHGISECVVLDISIPRVDDMTVGHVVIYCQAFRKPVFALAKPIAAKQTPTDPIDAQIDSKVALVNAQREALARKVNK